MPKLGSAGYSAPQAIAELVDNSIDARIDGRKLIVAISISKSEIIVADNGRGMDESSISNALKLAHSEKRGRLGQFGLGLKTACFSLGHRFEVRTSAEGIPAEFRIAIDEDEWLRQKAHWHVELVQEPCSIVDHFTIVHITRLRNAFGGMDKLVTDDLGRRYSPFLANGEVEITVNKHRCQGLAPDLEEETRQDFELFTDSGARIWGWYGLLKQGSSRGCYGFSTYRLGRMITAFDKIGIPEHPTVSRIVGEIHLDHLPVTHNKREFIKDSREYRETERLLRKVLEGIVRLARQRAAEETVTRTVKAELERIKDTVSNVLHKPEFKPFTDLLVGPSEPKEDPAGTPENIPAEMRAQSEPTRPRGMQTEPPKPPGSKEREPKRLHEKLRRSIRILGKTIHFEHQFSSLGTASSWKSWTFDSAKGLEILTNTDFPAFHLTRDKSFYAVLQISESIAEFWTRESGESADRVDELKERILRRVSEALEGWSEDAFDSQSSQQQS